MKWLVFYVVCGVWGWWGVCDRERGVFRRVCYVVFSGGLGFGE